MSSEDLTNTYQAGQIVWGKVWGYPWWPGRVALVEDGRVLVNFIGHESHANLTPNMVRPYHRKDAFVVKIPSLAKSKRSIDRGLARAMQAAMEAFENSPSASKDSLTPPIIEGTPNTTQTAEFNGPQAKFGRLGGKLKTNGFVKELKCVQTARSDDKGPSIVTAINNPPSTTNRAIFEEFCKRGSTQPFVRGKAIKEVRSSMLPFNFVSRATGYGITVLPSIQIIGSSLNHKSTSHQAIHPTVPLRGDCYKISSVGAPEGTFGGYSSDQAFPKTPEEVITRYRDNPIPLKLHRNHRVGRVIQKMYESLPVGRNKSRLATIIRREKERLKRMAWKGTVVNYSSKPVIDLEGMVEHTNQGADTLTFQPVVSSRVSQFQPEAARPAHTSDPARSTDQAISVTGGSDTPSSQPQGHKDPKGLGLGDHPNQSPHWSQKISSLLIKEEHGSMLTKLRIKVIRRLCSKLIEEFKVQKPEAKELSLTIESVANGIYPTMEAAHQYIAAIKNYIVGLKFKNLPPSDLRSINPSLSKEAVLAAMKTFS